MPLLGLRKILSSGLGKFGEKKWSGTKIKRQTDKQTTDTQLENNRERK